MCWIRHRRRTWGNLTKYNVGRWLENNPEEVDLTGCTKKKPQTSSEAFLCGIRQRPTLPGDFACLNPAQRRGSQNRLTKYNAAHWLGQSGKHKAFRLYEKKRPTLTGRSFLFMESGNVLLSQVVSNQVPSALKGLTSVFGMGTGGSLSPLSPENCEGFVQSFVFLVSAPSLHNRSFHLGDFPHISRFIFYCAYPENRTSRLLTSRITSFPIFPLVSTQFF